MRTEGNAPKKWRTNSLSLIHDNAPAHQSVFVKDFLAKNNVTTLEHSKNSPDLVPADFYIFPNLKLALKGRSFYDAVDIIKNAMEELKRLSQNDFEKCFQPLHSL
jgi:transposase